MGSNYEWLSLPEDGLPSNLCERVLERIFRERVRLARIRFVGASLLGLVSLGAGVVVARETAAAAAESGFTTYLSLLFSDSGMVGSHMASFTAMLAEALPATGAALLLFLAATFLVSIRSIIRAFPMVRSRALALS